MIVYKILDNARREKGLKWSYLESLIGAYRGKFSEYNNGKTTLTDDEERTIASNLGVSLEYLEGKTDKKNKPETDDSFRLTKDEIELIKSYRSSNPEIQAAIDRLTGIR